MSSWVRLHIIAMGMSYILLLTAFYVDNGKSLPLWKELPPIAYWLLPGAIGVLTRLLQKRVFSATDPTQIDLRSQTGWMSAVGLLATSEVPKCCLSVRAAHLFQGMAAFSLDQLPKVIVYQE
jgi:hypothetical protein